ncbi:MAG: hypothetical protein ACRD2W_24600 [Acidimicrobiales bacterium]
MTAAEQALPDCYEAAIPRLRRAATMSLMNGASNRAAHRRRRHVCLGWVGGVAALALVACSGGGGGAVTAAPVTAPTTSDTTTVPTTPTSGPPTSTSTTTTTPRPVVVDGVPQVAATPARAAVGARVRIEGAGFTDPMWRASGTTLWIADKTGCNLYAQAEHTVIVSAAGRLTGEFVVPSSGACRMSTIGDRPVTSGAYRIVFTCTACSIGELEVTTTAGPCADVGFSPNSDNLAGGIIANGLSCAEAEALVRNVGPQVHAIGGPSRVEVDGFVCERTAQSERFLPTSDFTCTSGTKSVTFVRA